MSEEDISSIRLTFKTKGRLNEERRGRETDEVLVNRLLDELKDLRAAAGK